MSTASKGAVNFASNAAAGNGAAKTWRGGRCMLIAEATWGGGSFKLQTQTSLGTWVDVASSTLSANGTLNLELPPGQYRGVGATGSAFYADLVHIPQ